MEWDQYLIKDVNRNGDGHIESDKFPVWDAPPTNGDIDGGDGYKWGTVLIYALFLCFIGLYETINTIKRYEDIRKL